MNEIFTASPSIPPSRDSESAYGIFRDPVFAHRAMMALVVLMVSTSLLWGERVAVNGGLGWDGVTYAALVRDIGNVHFTQSLGTYYAQRILPSFLVRQALLLFGSKLGDHDIIFAFAIMNGLICIALADVWRRIANALALSTAGRWVGFLGLFMNFELSKQSMFYPVLTDPMALLLSALLLLFFLKRNVPAIFGVAVIGAFCWPTLGITGALLCIFMTQSTYRPQQIKTPAAEPALNLRRLYWPAVGVTLVAIVLTTPIAHSACVRGLGSYNVYSLLPGNIAAKFESSETLHDPCLLAQQVFTALPAFVVMALAMIILLWPMVRTNAFKGVFTRQRCLWTAVGIAILIVAWLGVKLISSPAVANPSSIALLVRLMVLPPVGKIFLPLVSLGAFWGPCFVFVVVAWPRIAAEARRLGSAIVLVLSFTLPFGLVGEPRFLTTVWPILVTLTAIVLGRPHPKRLYVSLAGASLLLAQFWLPINIVPWPPGLFAHLEEFPKQLFFMHYGLWMGWLGYGVQAVILIGIGWMLRPRSPLADQRVAVQDA